MRLSAFIKEAKDSLKHTDPEIEKILAEIATEAEKVGLKQAPFNNDEGYTFKDDSSEAMAYFTDGILELVVLVDNPSFPGDDFDVTIILYVKEKFSFDGEKQMLSQLYLKNMTKEEALKTLNALKGELPKIEGLVDWVFDVTEQHPHIKFKKQNFGASLPGGTQFKLPNTLIAIGGIFHFGDKEDTKVY